MPQAEKALWSVVAPEGLLVSAMQLCTLCHVVWVVYFDVGVPMGACA